MTETHKPARFGVLLLVLIAVTAISAIFATKGPFQDSHWDAPIYLMRGKIFADTPLLDSIATHAPRIAEAVRRGREARAEGPWHYMYWPFMRLGNTVLLGAVTYLLGSSEVAIEAAFLLYTVFMAGTVAMGVLLSIWVVEAFGDRLPTDAVVKAASLSGLLYIGSDIYRYLSGNLVAEIPGIFFLTGSALSLVAATRWRSVSLAILSGMLAFALYAVKMEGVWASVAFCLLLAALFWRFAPEAFWLPAFMVTAASAFISYLIYAWWFYPLADPRLLADFADALASIGKRNPISSFKPLLAAGGVLWLGLVPAIIYGWRSPALWLSLGWLVLLVMPYGEALINNRPAQARMFAFLACPLLLASAVGWAALLSQSRAARRKLSTGLLLAASVVLILISQEESYQVLRKLPSGWRLQEVRQYLSPVRYERVDYPISELAELSRFLYARPSGQMLLWNWDDGPLAEYIDLIRYLGPPIPALVDPLTDPIYPSNRRNCSNEDPRLRFEPVLFCTDLPSPEAVEDLSVRMRLLGLYRAGSRVPRDTLEHQRMVFETDSLAVYEWFSNKPASAAR